MRSFGANEEELGEGVNEKKPRKKNSDEEVCYEEIRRSKDHSQNDDCQKETHSVEGYNKEISCEVNHIKNKNDR